MIVVGIVMLLCVCAAAGFGMWAGYSIGVDVRADEHARALAIATSEAEQLGYLRGVLDAHTPAPPGAPYDWNSNQ